MPNSNQQEYPKLTNELEGLRIIFRALRKYQHPQLDDGTLSKLRIKPPTSLGKEGSQFFAPFNAKAFDELWAKSEAIAMSDPEYECGWPNFSSLTNYGRAYHVALFLEDFYGRWLDEKRMLYEAGPWVSRDTDRTPLENCLDRGRASRGGEHDCVITRIFDNDDLSYPHIGYAMIEDADLTDRLLWSEVYSAACFMARRLLLTEYKMHQFAPVFVITLSGTKARILQAHFDTRLILQKSEIIELGKENYDGIKYLVRWMMCQPKGNTLCDTPAKDFR